MTVKADSKGRLTGADPGEQYNRHISADGTITYTPSVVRKFEEARIVTEEEFEQFFGVPVGQVKAEDIQVIKLPNLGNFHHHGFVMEVFATDEEGNFLKYGGTNERVVHRKLIQIEKK